MVQKIEKSRMQNNVRQLGSTESSSGGQHQILSALDTLGAKLVRSESERETMRRLLNEALEAQDRLETQLERSQIHIERRLDQVEDQDTGLSEDDKEFIEDQKRTSLKTKEILDDQLNRQLKVEDKLRDSQQTIQKLQRRLDSQEQKRAKLQRRIERVENIASDAQNALEAKAVVLLTDQSEQVRHLRDAQEQYALQAMKTLNQLHAGPITADEIKPEKTSWADKFKFSGSIIPVLLALGLGWMMAGGSNQNMVPVVTQNIDTPTVAEEIISFETDWITDDILDQAIAESNDIGLNTSAFDVLETMQAEEITMDRDLTLPDTIKELEDKAFAKIPEAQHDLGALYTAGQAGVTQNYERAGFWFEKAAEQGIGNAAYNLGVLYQQGLGAEQDLQRALDWYRRAAQLGHPEAQYNLGISYIEGVGTRYNPNMAAAFFQQAAFNGVAEAAYNLGLILENGLLGEVRPDDALKWYHRAAVAGNVDAQGAYQTLATSMGISTDLATAVNDTDINLGTLVPSNDQIMVAQIQEQLRKAGLYTGPQDGIVGAGTVKAMRTYQRQNNIPADGQATQTLLTFMLQQGTGL